MKIGRIEYTSCFVTPTNILLTLTTILVSLIFLVTYGTQGAAPAPSKGTVVGTFMENTDLPGNDLSVNTSRFSRLAACFRSSLFTIHS